MVRRGWWSSGGLLVRGQEVLRKTLQHAAGLVDRHLLGRVEPAGHRHLQDFAAPAVHDQREIGARRGPTGTIGTNRPDGFMIAEHIAADTAGDSGKKGRAGLDALLTQRGVDLVTFRDWQKIDQAEMANARHGAPREKFVAVDAMMDARE